MKTVKRSMVVTWIETINITKTEEIKVDIPVSDWDALSHNDCELKQLANEHLWDYMNKNGHWLEGEVVTEDCIEIELIEAYTQSPREYLNELMRKYYDLVYKINVEEANGNLATLCDLNFKFDETFDKFFDNPALRKKYGAWNYKEDGLNGDVTNDDLANMLDCNDLSEYIEFVEEYVSDLECELAELLKEEE